MREVLQEYGATLIAGVATVMLISIFGALVFSKNGPLSVNLSAYAKSYAGDSSDTGEIMDAIASAKAASGEAYIRTTPVAGEVYWTDELFLVPEESVIRVSRVAHLDEPMEEGDSLYSMTWDFSDDVTDQVVSDRGLRLCFVQTGYYELFCVREDDRGGSHISSFLVFVRG